MKPKISTPFQESFSEKGDKSKLPRLTPAEKTQRGHQRGLAAAMSAKAMKKTSFLSFLESK